MSFEEQQRDELDALDAIYADEYECTHNYFFYKFLIYNSWLFLVVLQDVNPNDLPKFSISIKSEQNDQDSEQDNCRFFF